MSSIKLRVQVTLNRLIQKTKVTYSCNTYKILNWFCDFFAGIHWQRIQAFVNGGIYYSLLEEDHDKIRTLLQPHYYFIVTRRSCHLTTYLIALISFIATGKVSHYTHALMNVDDGATNDIKDFKLIEATASGVHFSTFMQVFDCDSVALIKPKNLSKDDWTLVIDKALKDLGKPYDDLFDVTQDTHLSCIELCRNSLQALPDYNSKFSNFEKMIRDYGMKLTPQMLYDCPDFEVKFERRR